MMIRLLPFPGSVPITVPISQIEYVLFVGKIQDCVPKCVPEEGAARIMVWIDAPYDDAQAAAEFVVVHRPQLEARVREWMVTPCFLN